MRFAFLLGFDERKLKILTIFVTIFIPLTFVTGLYGMNFNPKTSPFNMPELNWYLGYPFALCIMAGIIIGMLIYFKGASRNRHTVA